MTCVRQDKLTEYVEDFISTLVSHTSHATVVGLSGELGSGKTTFVQVVACALGVTEHVTSPTFVILKTYNLKPETHNLGFKKLIHMDAYRLERGEELQTLGWDTYFNNNRNLIFIEWPEHVKEILPSDIEMLTFKYIDEQTRDIKTQ